MTTTPSAPIPATASHLFAMSALASHPRGLPTVGDRITRTPAPPCHFCADTAPPVFPRYTIAPSWYPRTFSDWPRIIDLTTDTICAACAYALKFGLKGFVLTATTARHLKPSSPEWAQLLINPPEPPFVLMLNCVHLKHGRLTADGANPRHLMLSSRVAWNRECFPVSYGVHELTWIRATEAQVLLDSWRTMIRLGAKDGLWKPAQIPKFLTMLCLRWLTDQALPTGWPAALHDIHRALPRPLLSSRLVLEFTIRRALIAEFEAHPPMTASTPARRRTTKKGRSR